MREHSHSLPSSLTRRYRVGLCSASSVPLSRRERQYNRALFSQFPLFYRSAFPSPKGEGFTDPLSGTLQGYFDVLKRYSDVLKGYSDVLRT